MAPLRNCEPSEDYGEDLQICLLMGSGWLPTKNLMEEGDPDNPPGREIVVFG